MNELNHIMNLLLCYLEIEKGKDTTRDVKKYTIINKMKIVLPHYVYIDYFYFINYFINLYI